MVNDLSWTSPLGTTRVLVPAPADPRYCHLSWPKVQRAPNGVLVLAYIAGRAHVNGDGCPAVSRSVDGGQTWSAPQILRHFEHGMPYQHGANLALGLAADGALVLLGMAFTDQVRHTIFGWRSPDAGLSWTPCNTTALADNRTGSVFGAIFPAPGLGLCVTGHYRQPTGQGLWFANSRDEGRTWGPPRTIIGEHLVEPSFMAEAGRLVGLVREDRAWAYHQLVSDDGGQTWQFTPRVIAGTAGATHPSPCLLRDPRRPGWLYALHTERTPQREIFLWEAPAATLHWRCVGRLLACPGAEDFGYPWMSHLSGDQWLLVFYGGQTKGANAIHGLSLTLPLGAHGTDFAG